MAKLTANKKLRILAAIAAAIALVLYLIFAKDIAALFEKHNEKLGYSDLADVFSESPKEHEIQVHIIDVGQGDSILIRSNSENILIDAGSSASEAALKAHLDACGIKKLDYFICTHPHDDHLGGADMICHSFDVGTVIMNGTVSTGYSLEALLYEIAEHEIPAEVPNIGDKYEVGDMVFTILGPTDSFDDYNETSLVVKLEFGESSFLFMGDAEEDSEKSMLGYYTNSELDCDFLKVGHHGSDTSSKEAFLNAVTPEIAAISCAKDNEYGHPRGEVISRLYKAGCTQILRTDRLGTVVISSDGKEITVVTDTRRK